MTFRRGILIVLLIVLSILLIYNSYIAPSFMRGHGQMGMGMHGRMWDYNYYNSFVDFRIILLIIIVIAIIFLLDILWPNSSGKRCSNCGNAMEDEWKICPICGSRNIPRKGVF